MKISRLLIFSMQVRQVFIKTLCPVLPSVLSRSLKFPKIQSLLFQIQTRTYTQRLNLVMKFVMREILRRGANSMTKSLAPISLTPTTRLYLVRFPKRQRGLFHRRTISFSQRVLNGLLLFQHISLKVLVNWFSHWRLLACCSLTLNITKTSMVIRVTV